MRRPPRLSGVSRPPGQHGQRRRDLSGVAIYTGIAIGRPGGSGGPPGIPTGLAATPGNGAVALAWNATATATSYQVRRSTTPGGPYATVGTPGTNSFNDTGLTNGTPYYYVVAAVNAAGAGGDSAAASATPTAFAPTSLAGLLVWFSSGAKYQDTGVVTPCAALNDPVGNWPDASGNGRDATQASDLLRPQYKPASQNGLPTVRFSLDRNGNSANSALKTASVPHGIGTGDFWWISVIKAGASVANRSICANGSFAPALYYQSGKLNLQGVGTFDTTLTPGSWYVVECWRIAGTARAAVNGVVEVSTFAYAGSMANDIWCVGNDNFSGDSYNEAIAEQLAYKRTPTLADRQSLVNYLGAKWAIAVTP